MLIQQFQGHGLSCVRGERLLFAKLAFQVRAGQLLILKGRNGAGKSSLLRMMAGFLAPYSGHFSLDDVTNDQDRDFFRQSIQYLGHKEGLKSDLTVTENLKFWASLNGVPTAGERIQQAMTQLHIHDLADLPVRYLSSGQTRRTSLARLLLRDDVPIWLLDEPVVGLDHDSRDVLATIMQSHLQRQGIIVAATHQDLGLKNVQMCEVQLDEFVTAPLIEEGV
ncbi:MAG: heme ABC transporter ATP-binding protein CcmA [Kordiimonas sp.]|nr:heme ABC transporter ATP-binding protein CcmA [Kordiimonas sp.]|tara:strand:- start:1025 stop:1690 length:666 start_codon:yes stop_codon:yes gene_type:complete